MIKKSTSVKDHLIGETYLEKVGYIYDGEHYVSIMDAERRSVILSQDKYNAFKPSIHVLKGTKMQSIEKSEQVNKIITEIFSEKKKLLKNPNHHLFRNLVKLKHHSPRTRWVYRIVVISLGLSVVGTIFGGFLLAFTSGASIPEGLIALGSAAVGALAGLLAPSPNK